MSHNSKSIEQIWFVTRSTNGILPRATTPCEAQMMRYKSPTFPTRAIASTYCALFNKIQQVLNHPIATNADIRVFLAQEAIATQVSEEFQAFRAAVIWSKDLAAA